MPELTNFEKYKALPWQLAGHVLTTVFIRTDFYGGAMFMLFLSELKLDKSRIGFLMSLLAAFGFLGLFFAPLTAKFGFKRSYMSFVIGRLVFVAPLLFLPSIAGNYGTQYAYWFLVLTMSGFAILKAFGEVAWAPWTQEVMPDSVRGKFMALVNVGTQFSSILVTGIAGYLIGKMAGFTPYIMMIYVGLCAGVLSIWCYAKMPAGSSVPSGITSGAHFKEMMESLVKDHNFLRYNFAISVVFISFYLASTFVPLFLKEEIGLEPKIVVWLDIANFAGSMVSCYFWGWASDRYGSKPVMLVGPLIWLPFPLLCLFMPHRQLSAFILGLFVMSIIGIGMMAWVLGINRYLFLTAMPEEKRTSYGAVYYANQTFAICIGPLIAGVLIDKMSSMRTWLAQYSVAPYAPIFILGFLGILAGTIIMNGVRNSGELTLFAFIKLFVRTDTVKSCLLIIRSQFAVTERQRLKLAGQMVKIKNPLIQKELQLLKNDPSFIVRQAVDPDAASDFAVLKQGPENVAMVLKTAGAVDLIHAMAKECDIEDTFYRYWKKLQEDPATGAAALLWKLRCRLEKASADDDLVALAQEASDAFAQHKFMMGNSLVGELAIRLPEKNIRVADILRACSHRIRLSMTVDRSCMALFCCLIEKSYTAQANIPN